ncbi:MAG: FKBP-type peptidyl-prolyl cis-trans isomerase [Magnetococcales bacterium]|nr:FKBP-type peptidyl-prolyl cis-trans isomerase [Magnetococcales bacterium]MBF0156985.1 FKBP-type peptidyl-prolyl cis-trans isomerase [Magnetococcales bacterium]
MACLFLTSALAQAGEGLNTNKDRISYAVGMRLALEIQNKHSDRLDNAMIVRGINDIMEGKKPLLTEAEADEAERSFLRSAQEDAVKKLKEIGEKNRKEGETYLAKNKTKPGVQITASGLQYEVIRAGNGSKPKASDTVKVHYRGTFIDGTEFDSSHKRKEPAVFPLKGVIPGWSEGVQLMTVGSQYRFVVPAALAYKTNGPGPIGPERTLIFEVELLEIL